jgi:hypothetical protein
MKPDLLKHLGCLNHPTSFYELFSLNSHPLFLGTEKAQIRGA